MRKTRFLFLGFLLFLNSPFLLYAAATPTPTVNELTFFDHFFADAALNGRSPDVSFSGGAWVAPSGVWKAGTTGVEWGFITGYTVSGPIGDTTTYFDLDVIHYPVLYNFSFRPLNLFESGSIIRGWQIRKGIDGTLAIVADTTSAASTTITVKSWDVAGNTTVIASALAPGVLPRPGYDQSSLVVVDTGDTLTVYWDYANVVPDAVARTATSLVLITNTTLWNANDRFGPWFEVGNGAYISNFVSVVEHYATPTPTPISFIPLYHKKRPWRY